MTSRFYTPPPVARRLVELVVEAAGGRLPDGPVLEPSVGAGALVLAWLEHAAGPVRDPASAGRAASLVRERLRAHDTDAEAVAATRAALVSRCAPWLPSRDAALGRVAVGDGFASAGEPAAVILCNPPWASFSGRQAVPREGAPFELVSQAAPGAAWPALHTRAVAGALARLRPDGVAGFVLPGQVATLAGYGPFRRALAERVRAVAHLGEGAFPGVESPTCLLAVGPPTAAALAVHVDGRRVDVAREALRKEPERPWLPRLEDRFATWPPPGFRLEPSAFADLGLHSGNSAATLFATAPFPGSQPVLEGRDVTPFRVAAPRLWFDPGAVPGPGRYFRISQWQRARDVPIVLRQTASRPVAALNPGHCFRNSLLGCRGVPGLSNVLVVAWLNSDPVARLLSGLAPDVHQRAFPQVKVGALRRLPWPTDPNADALRTLERLAPLATASDGAVEERTRVAINRWVGEICLPILGTPP